MNGSFEMGLKRRIRLIKIGFLEDGVNNCLKELGTEPDRTGSRGHKEELIFF